MSKSLYDDQTTHVDLAAALGTQPTNGFRDINGQLLSVVKINEKDTFLSQDSGTEGLSDFFNSIKPTISSTNFDTNVINLQQKADERHSLFPIHKAMFFYTWRFINGLSLATDVDKQKAFNQVYQDLNAYINADIAKFLNSRPNISISDINAYIDENRETYALMAEGLVASALVINSHELKDKKEAKAYFKEKTALNIDMIETNKVTGIITHTHGVEDSSHSKKHRPPAITKIEKYIKNPDGTLKLIQTQYRTPSLVDAEVYEDTCLFSGETLAANQELTVEQQVADFVKVIVEKRGEDEKNTPIVYNLLTSLSSSNKQDKTAKKNFLAMHAYNKTAFNDSSEQTQPLYYVMNIPVNQFGDTLDLKSGNSLAKEAAFFADLATFDTMPKKILGEDNISAIEDIKKLYQAFLADPKAPPYFCKSSQWKDARNKMIELKTNFSLNFENFPLPFSKFEENHLTALYQLVGDNSTDINPELGSKLLNLKQQAYAYKAQRFTPSETYAIKEFLEKHGTTNDLLTKFNQCFSNNTDGSQDSTEDKLRKAYLKLYLEAFSGEMTLQKELSSLIQGMFLALNDNDNLKGCKSGVDRYSFVEGLDNLFLSYLHTNPESAVNKEIEKAVTDYLSIGSTEDFAIAIHTINNKYNAYSSSMDASFNDANDAKNIASGRSSPLKAAMINTNKFIPSIYTNIKQGNAPIVQAEKNAAKRAVELVEIAQKRQEQLKDYISPPRKEIQSEHLQTDNESEAYKQLCITVLSEYTESWSWRKNHKEFAKAAIKSLDDASTNVTKTITGLREKIYTEKKFNPKGELHARLNFLLEKAPKPESPSPQM